MRGRESRANVFPGESGAVDPDYFALRVRQALREQGGDPESYPDDPLESVADPGADELGEFVCIAEHPDVIEAEEKVTSAEIAVLVAEDAGAPDEVAMRRLDKAREARRAVLVRLQKRRVVAHTQRAVSRPAQVVPMRPALRVVAGGEAA